MTDQVRAVLSQVTESHTEVVRVAIENGLMDQLRRELQNLAWAEQALENRLDQLDRETTEAQ